MATKQAKLDAVLTTFHAHCGCGWSIKGQDIHYITASAYLHVASSKHKVEMVGTIQHNGK